MLPPFALPLSHIINSSLLTGIFTSKSRIAKLVQVYKNSKRDDPYKYRPVSTLPDFSNILEKLIANRLFAFLKNSIRYEYQFGFTPG